jgi:hypothetical protein
MEQTTRPLLDVRGAREYMSERWTPVSEGWVRKHQQSGLLPYLKITGMIRFDPDELDKFIESCRHPAKAAAL